MVVKALTINNPSRSYEVEESIQIPSTAKGWDVQNRREGQQNTDFRVATKPGQVVDPSGSQESTGDYFSSGLESNQGHQHVMCETSDILTDPLTLYIAVTRTQPETLEVRYW